MAKLYIATNKKGGYYSKITNSKQDCSIIVSVNLPRGVELSTPYGTFDCDYYLSCFKTKEGTPTLVIKVTKINDLGATITNPEINPAGVSSINAYEDYNKTTPELPF